MTITLPPHLNQFLRAEVASGRYPTFADAVADAVERLRQERTLEALQGLIDEGLAAIDRGELIEIDSPEDEESFFAGLMGNLDADSRRE